jgi:hypothetical protein
MRCEKRLHALEARRAARERPASDLIDALHRACTAAVRAKLARRLDEVADTPEQAAQHAALLAQWRDVRGDGTTEGARGECSRPVAVGDL